MNKEKFYLGKLCKNNHSYEDTGESLRLKSDSSCYQCRKAYSKNKPKRSYRTNSLKYQFFEPSEIDKILYPECNDIEMWKSVVGKINNLDFDDLRKKGKDYEISNFGRLRYWKKSDWFYIKGCSSSGYKRTNIRYNGKLKTVFIHVLMAYTFLEKPKSDDFIVRHLNDDGLSNYISNLNWGSFSDNAKDNFKNSMNKQLKEKLWTSLTDDELKQEIWKKLYETKFFISSMGRLKNSKGEIISCKTNRTGYLCYNVRVGRIRSKYKLIHKMVAEHFIEKSPDKTVIRHLDDNKLNNRVSNLCYGTQQQNINDRRLNNKYNSPLGENHANSKLFEWEVVDIKNKLDLGFTSYRLSKEYNVSRNLIDDIKHGKIWKHVEI